MNVTLKGNQLTITAELDEAGTLSATGKTKLHVTTKGAKESTVKVNGKPLIINLNAYTYATDKPSRAEKDAA